MIGRENVENAPVVAEWMQHGACRGSGAGDLFFPATSSGAGGVGPDAYEEARKFCNRCPVRLECLEYALTIPNTTQLPGMWGGLTPTERKKERAERRRQRRGGAR